MFRTSSQFQPVLQAVFVTFLWSTSWVFIKIGLDDIPALTFAGLRYAVAFVCLLPLLLRRDRLAEVRRLTFYQWRFLAALGLLLYAVTQGAQFLALSYLPAITTNLMFGFTSIVVAVLAVFFLAEFPTRGQWIASGINIAGVIIFFYPLALPTGEMIGLAVALVGVAANAGSALLGRYINRDGALSPTVITGISMGIGAAALLTTGILTQGLPQLGLRGLAIVAWLALANTAFAFTLWNRTLRALSVMESSIINSTMMIQIPLLAMIFLGERISLQEAAGMIVAGIGVILVQVWR